MDLTIKILKDGRWTDLETTIDSGKGTATAMISHFSVYGLFGKENRKSSFSMGSFTEGVVVSEDAAITPTPEVVEVAPQSTVSRTMILIAIFAFVMLVGLVIMGKR